MDLAAWLLRLGLERHQPTLVENAIDLDIIAGLTETDLERFGIPLGDRRRLLKAAKLLAAGTRGGAERLGSTTSRPAERRHLTVMICDLVGSTELFARLDPEDARQLIDAYHAACTRICLAHDGYVSEFLGDGVLAYFGHPRAHEDDAERTVRAGLEIIDQLAQVDLAFAGPIAVRIGIATGVVVIDELDSGGSLSERSVFGTTPSLAARLQTLAAPGTIVVSASTRRLLGNLFHFRDLGRHSLKGFAEPVPAWTVEGIAVSESRFASTRATALTDFVGRADAIAFLLQRQLLAWRGEGQVVLITGEPGIGKSRLAAAFAERASEQSYTPLVFQCSPYHASSELHPVIANLERTARFKKDDTPSRRLNKLGHLLLARGLDAGAMLPVFAALLSLPFSSRDAFGTSPAEQRRRILQALLDCLEILTCQRPVLLLFEDAHWADATSRALLEQVVARARHLRLFLLVTSRPGFEPSWAASPHASTLSLQGLDVSEVERIATLVSGGRALPLDVMRRIVAKTDGNPLFIEELTKTVLESEMLVEDGPDGYRLNGPLPTLAIPATLHDSLMARLDRAAPMKRVSQIGAAIGREFSFALLQAVAGDDQATLLEALGQLERTGLVFRRGEPPEAEYSFKHALVRDAAYESLLRTRRQSLHEQIARALEESFPLIAASEPEIVAHHLLEANHNDRAIDYLLKAGIRALRRSANAEAVQHLRRGLCLVQSQLSQARFVPDGAPATVSARKELDFHLALGPALAATEGYAALETLAAFSRARELLADGATLTEQMTVLWGAYLAHNMRAEHGLSLEVARHCLVLAEQHRHAGISALANRFLGQTLNIMGSLGEARRHLERTIFLCTENEKAADYRDFGIDDRVGAQFNLARTFLLLGHPDRSAAKAEEAIERAQSLGRPFTTALALTHAGIVGVLACKTQGVAGHVEHAIAHSASHGLLEPEQKARFMKGALLAQAGDPAGGLDIMHKAMVAEGKAVQSDTVQYRSLYLGLMASAHLTLGEPRLGLELLQDAIGNAEATGEKFYYAELFRLRSMMLIALGARPEGEAALQRALTVARDQGARWWELRAATTLAGLWHSEGRSRQARSVLQPIYAWFDEGLDTAVLGEAKALLDQLAQVPASH